MTTPRRKLPDTRASVTTVVRHTPDMDIYLTLSFFPTDPDSLGEVFIKIGKEGSTLGGLCDIVAVLISLCLQFGVPWSHISQHLKYTNFDPRDVEDRSVGHAIAERIDQIIHERTNVDGNQKGPVSTPTDAKQ